MGNCPLQYPVKGDRLGRVTAGCRRDGRYFFRKKRLQPLFKGIHRTTAFTDDIGGEVVMQQAVEHVLHGDELVFVYLCLFNCFYQRCFKGLA